MIRLLLIPVACLPVAFSQVIGIPDPSSEFPADKTVVWSPVFQDAWDRMNQSLGGKPIRVDPENALMERLDNFEWNAEMVMPQEGWKNWAGPATRELLDEVNKEAALMTGRKDPVFEIKNKDPRVLAIFSLVTRDVEFLKPFFRSRSNALNFGKENEPVQYFGVRSEAAADYESSVRVLAYRPAHGSHAVELACKGTDETVILYMPSEPQDFATACRWIRHWRANHHDQKGKKGRWNDGQLHEDDDLRVPYVSLDVQSDFTKQLDASRIHGDPPVPWRILSARQDTKFRLHEKGAHVTAAATIELIPFGGQLQRSHPRNFIYDRPFFVFLWRATADWPYVGVWVGDTSALQPME